MPIARLRGFGCKQKDKRKQGAGRDISLKKKKKESSCACSNNESPKKSKEKKRKDEYAAARKTEKKIRKQKLYVQKKKFCWILSSHFSLESELNKKSEEGTSLTTTWRLCKPALQSEVIPETQSHVQQTFRMCLHVSVFLNLDSSEHSKEFNHDACSLTPLISLDQMPMSTMLSEASSVKKTILIHLNPLRCLILPHHHRQ